jgi:predicted phosphodiesterase
MDWVKHVFFGHTHVKFDNIVQDGIAFHNTGAFTQVKSHNPELLGVLEATLTDGMISNVKPVQLQKQRSR